MSPITEIAPSDVPPAERDPVRETAGPGDPAGRRRRAAWVHNPLVLTAIVVIVLVVLVSRLHSTEHDLVTAYRHLSWARFPWLVLALGAEAVSFVCYALVQRSLLLAGGARLTRRTMVALAVAATGLTNLVPGGTAPASGWLVGQYRRREIPMPLALWAVLAGGFAATVSILTLLLAGAAIARLIGPLGTLGCAAALAAGATLVVVAAHRLPALSRWAA